MLTSVVKVKDGVVRKCIGTNLVRLFAYQCFLVFREQIVRVYARVVMKIPFHDTSLIGWLGEQE